MSEGYIVPLSYRGDRFYSISSKSLELIRHVDFETNCGRRDSCYYCRVELSISISIVISLVVSMVMVMVIVLGQPVASAEHQYPALYGGAFRIYYRASTTST